MTTPRTVQMQRKASARSYEPTGDGHVELFAGLAQAFYSEGLRNRWTGLRRMVAAARKLGAGS